MPPGGKHHNERTITILNSRLQCYPMLGKLSPEQIEDVLQKTVFGHLGCHADDETYVVPISFVYDGQAIYCHTLEGKKTSMMRKNPKVCFQTDDLSNMGKWRSVIVQGKFEELTRPEDRRAAIHLLLQRCLPIVSSEKTHLGENWPFQPNNGNDIGGVIFRILPSQKSGRFEETSFSPNLPG